MPPRAAGSRAAGRPRQQGRRVVLDRAGPGREVQPLRPRRLVGGRSDGSRPRSRRRARPAAAPVGGGADGRGVRVGGRLAEDRTCLVLGEAALGLGAGPASGVGSVASPKARRGRFVGRSAMGGTCSSWLCSWWLRAHRVATSTSVLGPGVGSTSGEDHQTLPLVARVPPRSRTRAVGNHGRDMASLTSPRRPDATDRHRVVLEASEAVRDVDADRRRPRQLARRGRRRRPRHGRRRLGPRDRAGGLRLADGRRRRPAPRPSSSAPGSGCSAAACRSTVGRPRRDPRPLGPDRRDRGAAVALRRVRGPPGRARQQHRPLRGGARRDARVRARPSSAPPRFFGEPCAGAGALGRGRGSCSSSPPGPGAGARVGAPGRLVVAPAAVRSAACGRRCRGRAAPGRGRRARPRAGHRLGPGRRPRHRAAGRDRRHRAARPRPGRPCCRTPSSGRARTPSAPASAWATAPSSRPRRPRSASCPACRCWAPSRPRARAAPCSCGGWPAARWPARSPPGSPCAGRHPALRRLDPARRARRRGLRRSSSPALAWTTSGDLGQRPADRPRSAPAAPARDEHHDARPLRHGDRRGRRGRPPPAPRRRRPRTADDEATEARRRATGDVEETEVIDRTEETEEIAR